MAPVCHGELKQRVCFQLCFFRVASLVFFRAVWRILALNISLPCGVYRLGFPSHAFLCFLSLHLRCHWDLSFFTVIGDTTTTEV